MTRVLTLVTYTVLLLLICMVVNKLTKRLACQQIDLGIKNPAQSSIWALVAVAISMSVLTMLVLAQRPMVLPDSTQLSVVPASNLFSQTIVMLINIMPALAIMLVRREPLRSVGLGRFALAQASIIGVILIVLSMGFNLKGVLSAMFHFESAYIFFAVHVALVAFGEEFLFRGYLQSRLTLWLGDIRGWILASILMVLAHLTPMILLGNDGGLDVLFKMVLLIPASFALGFVMLRTRHLVAPFLFHAAANWVGQL